MVAYGMSHLSIEGLSKLYDTPEGPLEAVSDMNLEIDDGEFMVFVGPSGCGKTTTLRCIAGLEAVTEGRISLDGEDITWKDPADRDMAMVFQSYALYQHMTARENMSFGLKLAGELPTDEIDRRVDDVAAMLDISELLEKHPGQLSGGQQQRVALGRAIVREPEVFLFDEPLSNLDAKLRTQMRTELEQLQAELGITSIYVTHDQTEAMTMGDRITIMDAGEVQQIGTPEEVYNHPANRFVAGFIGDPSMNFWTTETVATDHGVAVAFDGQRYPLSEPMADLVAEHTDGRLTVGVRPEDLDVLHAGDSPDTPVLETDVQVVEPLGNENLVHFELAGTECVSRVDSDVKPDEKSTVSVTFDERDLYAFTPDGDSFKTRRQALGHPPVESHSR
jgi:multiple sugar transport system ATP-binding protein